MKKIFCILIIILSLVSCSKKPKSTLSLQKTVTDTTSVNGIILELSDSTGKGNLTVYSNKYKTSGKIKITPPCYFLKRNGKVLSFSYPDINVDETIIIQGKNGVQGIIFKKDSIIYEDYFPTTSPYNVKEGADEIVYQDFAHRFYKNKY